MQGQVRSFLDLIMNNVQHFNERKRNPRQISTLVGSSNEAQVYIQGIPFQSLIDTASAFSTVSRKFYETHLSDIPLQSVDKLLTLECADGTMLPYHGFIVCELQIDGISDKPETCTCLFLVVNQTNYHETVPVLIGTNILSTLLNDT